VRIALHLPRFDFGAVNAALEGLVRANSAELARDGFTQSILGGAVRYRRESIGREDWRTRSRVLLDGYGDCEDLSAALAAELRMCGVPAVAHVRRSHSGVGYHAVVVVRGVELDPSKWLGM
jgi:hypothetical protein